MDTLGKTLKKARESKSLTLREIEISTGISNAYLSQLENDKIKKPSASILYKLSEVYAIKMNDLLYSAGIIETQQYQEQPKQTFLEKEIAFYKDKLSISEEREVVDFIKFLRYKKNDGHTI